MKEKKLYKIAFMGDKDHGCDIISTLESWGGSNYYTRTGSDPEYVYFINNLGSIDFIHNSEMLSKEMKNFYFMFWHDYIVECQLKVGESINYGGQDYNVDSILFDANNRRIVYKLKSFDIGVEYITNNELTPTEEYQTEEKNNEYLCKNNMKRKLAIRGHATRGKEVIELLEMMGGKNNCDCPADNLGLCYLIDDEFDICAHYFGYDDYEDGELNIFTLEEFLEKYPFKVGDKVHIYVQNDDTDGRYDVEVAEISSMRWNRARCKIAYKMKDINREFYKEEIKCKVDDSNKSTRVMEEKDKAKAPNLKGEYYSGKRFGYKIPDGYEFDVVVDGKIILKPIKPKYPTTYEDCCKVLGISYRAQLSYTYPDVERGNIYLTKEKHLLDAFMKLRICRNAYWKIAGEQMGLGKPWEPDWKHGKDKFYCICTTEGEIVLGEWYIDNKVLAFPTEKMRDAFYENFKKEIEQCKELL